MYVGEIDLILKLKFVVIFFSRLEFTIMQTAGLNN